MTPQRLEFESDETNVGELKNIYLDTDLIRAKEAMGRPHDQLTILQLRAIQARQRGGS